MKAQVNDLVTMGDVQTLYELMAEDDDWMIQLDAAEGLVKLGDERGLEFLLSAEQSEEEEVRQVAREILASPAVARKRDELEAEEKAALKGKIETAKGRLQKGRKVFRYKMVFLPAGDILNEDPLSEGFDLPALSEFGLEGWEVVNLLPRRKQLLAGNVDDHVTGVYLLLKKELAPEDSAELDEL